MAKVSVSISRLLRWIPAIFIMGVIFILSSTPSSNLPEFGAIEMLVEMGGHFLGYALLAQAFLFGLGKQGAKFKLFAGMLAILYGVSDEIHQSFVPGRDASLIDLGIDLLGILAGFSTTFIYHKVPLQKLFPEL